MISLRLINNQLAVETNGATEYYSFEDIKSISPYKYSIGPYSATSGKEFIVINFINESRNSSLKLDFSLIENPVFSDLNDAVSTISGWRSDATTGALDANSRSANLIRETADGTISGAYSASFANVGLADGIVGLAILKPGETVNFDAGAINNIIQSIEYDATGTEFLIAYIS